MSRRALSPADEHGRDPEVEPVPVVSDNPRYRPVQPRTELAEVPADEDEPIASSP